MFRMGSQVVDSTRRSRSIRWRTAVVGALAASCLAGGGRGRADEPVAERRLTVAEAERLVADDLALVINLADVRLLEPEAARVLARCRNVLVLSGLTDLTPNVAAILATCPGVVDLSGLRSLAPETADALADYRGPQVDLSGVWPVTPEVIELARVTAVRLDVKGYRRLPRLTLGEARTLVKQQEWDGELPALVELPPDVAEVLVESGRNLKLTAVRSVSSETATALAAARGFVQLAEGVRVEGPEAEALAAAPNIGLPITMLTLELARGLAVRPGNLTLPQVTELAGPDADVIARFLGGRQGHLSLPSLRRISGRALSALVEMKRDLEIPSLTDLEIVPDADGTNDDVVVPGWMLERKGKEKR